MSLNIVKDAHGTMHLSGSDWTFCNRPLKLLRCVLIIAVEPGADFGSHIQDCHTCIETAKTTGVIR